MIRVSNTQRGNPLLAYLPPTGWRHDDAASADYEMDHGISVLFLTLKFHVFRPEYVYKRVNRMHGRLKVLLLLIDVPNYNLSLRELFDTVPVTVVPCRSFQECSRFLRGFDMAARGRVEAEADEAEAFLRRFPGLGDREGCERVRRGAGTLGDLLEMDGRRVSRAAGMSTKRASAIARYFDAPFAGGEV